MTPPPALTDNQIREILAIAEHVPQNFRGRFLENVADRLFPHTTVTDEQVREAIEYVASRFNVRVEAPP